jgi:hypothetical protein
MLEKSFLKHLEFKGLLKYYSLDSTSIRIFMNVPNSYKEQINQKILDQKYDNFSKFANEEYFSKSFLMKKYLK